MRERTLYMMIGAPGSGKSTLAKELGEAFNIPVVSSDDVREELFGNAACQKHQDRVWNCVFDRVNRHLFKKKKCILDATNTKFWVRNNAINRSNVDRVNYIIMDTSLEECLERNANRDRVVPENVIRRMYDAMTFLTPEEDVIDKTDVQVVVFHESDIRELIAAHKKG